MTLHFLNDVSNGAESIQKSTSTSYLLVLRVNGLGKLLNRIHDSGLLISSLPGSARECLLNHSASLAMSTSVLEALPGKLYIKRHSPSILYLFGSIYSSNPRVLPLFVPVGGHPAWEENFIEILSRSFFSYPQM